MASQEMEEVWRSEDKRLKKSADFSAVFLSDKVISGLKEAGYHTPSPVQLEAIPLGLKRKDFMAQAKPGTGKTLVYVAVALERLLENVKFPQVLIVAPYHEIAIQIKDVIKKVTTDFEDFKCEAVIGGFCLEQDSRKTGDSQIVVGTPGRLRKLIELGMLAIHAIRILVLDDIDHLLNECFKEDLKLILEKLPKQKQSIATCSCSSIQVTNWVQKNFKKPKMALLNKDAMNNDQLSLLGVTHYFAEVECKDYEEPQYEEIFPHLETILNSVEFTQCIVFSSKVERYYN